MVKTHCACQLSLESGRLARDMPLTANSGVVRCPGIADSRASATGQRCLLNLDAQSTILKPPSRMTRAIDAYVTSVFSFARALSASQSDRSAEAFSVCAEHLKRNLARLSEMTNKAKARVRRASQEHAMPVLETPELQRTSCPARRGACQLRQSQTRCTRVSCAIGLPGRASRDRTRARKALRRSRGRKGAGI